MKDERIKPTEENNCTKMCPSYDQARKMCAVTGYAPSPIEAPSELTNTPSKCDAAIHAKMDAYEAERKARREKPPRQEYAIANGSSTAALMLDVQEMMRMGWNPSGGVCGGEMGFHQAMVRDKE